MLQIKIDSVILEDKLRVNSVVRAEYGEPAASIAFSKGFLSFLVRIFLQSYVNLITKCKAKALTRVAVELLLYYSQTVHLFETSGLSKSEDCEMATVEHEKARNLL
jgi:hypothetical protein